MNEHALKRAVDRWLRTHAPPTRLWWLKVHGGLMQRAGVPDYLFCIDGRFIAIELKAAADIEPSHAQMVEMARIRRAGGSTHVASSVAEVARIIEQCLENE